MNSEVEDIRRRLRTGKQVLDFEFDLWLPATMQVVSRRFWTPIAVTTHVTSWLSELGARTVLDVGSGPGKFCVVGALRSSLMFTGIEHRAHLVDCARDLSARLGVAERTDFLHGALETVDFRQFDALYFYNPFGENVHPWTDHLDSTVELSRARFNREIVQVERLLERMPVGTHLATYNGYGGRVPDSFELVHTRIAGIIALRLWRKARECTRGGHWLERGDSTELRQRL